MSKKNVNQSKSPKLVKSLFFDDVYISTDKRQEYRDILWYEILKFDQNFKLAYNKNDIYFCRRIVN